MVTYAPWCQFCQAMEADYEALAKELGVTVAKYRGDEERDFVAKEFAVESFPSISVFKGGKMTKYTSEARDTASLKAFVEANM